MMHGYKIGSYLLQVLWQLKKVKTSMINYTNSWNQVLQMMSKYYMDLVKNPPKDKQVCKCTRNVDDNGVKKFLNYMALKIR